MDQDKEGEKVEHLLQDYLSGETNDEKNQRSQDQHPGIGSLSGESEIDEKIPDEKQDLENNGEFSWMRRRHKHDLEERAVSSTTSSTDDDSRNSGIPIQTGTDWDRYLVETPQVMGAPYTNRQRNTPPPESVDTLRWKKTHTSLMS